MSVSSRLANYRKHNPLAIKLLAAIILCSSVITVLATSAQLYSDYRYERSAIDQRIQQIESTSLASIENSLWEISPAQIQLQLEGLNQISDVQYITLDTPFNEHYSSGDPPESASLQKEYNLTHIEKGKIYPLGKLRIIISLDNLYQRLWDKTLLILLSQGVKTFLVSIFILSIIYHLVTQHLAAMASYARSLRLDKLAAPLLLKRSRNNQSDELGEVVDSFNAMRKSMLSDMQKRTAAEAALAQLNTELELRVAQRTEQLQQANSELQQSLAQLQRTQSQLVESKKMAALGSLVAGVAHEISTPIGIGYTAASFLEQQSRQFSGELADLALESSQMIRQNLERAATLITAFKQVSVDQTSEQRRHFNMADYLQEILISLQPRLRNSCAKINVNCPQDLSLHSYPGSFYQIFNNLILNSLMHGVPSSKSKIGIQINIRVSDEKLIIDYTDDGLGLSPIWAEKVFEPFATSKRNQGCSGLGMHICYNIINQLLGGEINCLTTERGAHFRISLPQHQD
ncbi:MAG: ATP-binding protein [Pseudomonadales bacterium]|nr:ATP-binding protein [Pseudomonadales bacterium]NRA17683.1 histidine kinase [Oceanospirillaceae bacterium]